MGKHCFFLSKDGTTVAKKDKMRTYLLSVCGKVSGLQESGPLQTQVNKPLKHISQLSCIDWHTALIGNFWSGFIWEDSSYILDYEFMHFPLSGFDKKKKRIYHENKLKCQHLYFSHADIQIKWSKKKKKKKIIYIYIYIYILWRASRALISVALETDMNHLHQLITAGSATPEARLPTAR